MRKCTNCSRQNGSSDEVARILGWRWYAGPSQTGKPLDYMFCPLCAGTRGPEDQPWNIVCNTCDWDFMSEDFFEGDEPLTTAKQAVIYARDHQCEPQIVIVDPDGNTTDLSDFDRDGNLKKARR